MENNHYDVIIIGAGAAGLLCAIEAGKRGRKVLLLDKADKAGKKILISGGGRCNFTNLHTDASNYLSANPHFCKSALARFTPWDFMALMSDHGLTWHEKTLGQLFCDQRAGAIVDMLLTLCRQTGVTLTLDTAIQSIEKHNDFEVRTGSGRWNADSLVIATGGPSIPRMGATDFGTRIAAQFGLRTIPFTPALVPLILGRTEMENLFNDLAGVSTEVVLSCNGHAFREQMLITHKGISGPAVLQISSYWLPGETLHANLLPDIDAETWSQSIRSQSPDAQLKTVLGRLLPKKLGHHLCQFYFSNKPIRQFTPRELQGIITRLQDLEIKPGKTEGLRTAEVSTGGVDTAELSSRTFESKRVPGLHFIGETVDVTGHLGGFNFQWAWASGWCAGQIV